MAMAPSDLPPLAHHPTSIAARLAPCPPGRRRGSSTTWPDIRRCCGLGCRLFDLRHPFTIEMSSPASPTFFSSARARTRSILQRLGGVGQSGTSEASTSRRRSRGASGVDRLLDSPRRGLADIGSSPPPVGDGGGAAHAGVLPAAASSSVPVTNGVWSRRVCIASPVDIDRHFGTRIMKAGRSPQPRTQDAEVVVSPAGRTVPSFRQNFEIDCPMRSLPIRCSNLFAGVGGQEVRRPPACCRQSAPAGS